MLLGHLDDPETAEIQPGRGYVLLRPDRVVLQDVLGQTAMLQFLQTRRRQVAVPTSVHCDHLIQARTDAASDLDASLAENNEVYEFLRAAAAHGLTAAASFLVTPGTEQIRATIERDGQLQALREIGGVILANACGPCIGQWRRPAPDAPNTIVTSYNRNFPKRNDGQSSTMSFIASPEIVTALALAGRLSFNPLSETLMDADGSAFRLEPPRVSPEVPAEGFERGRPTYVAPPRNGDDIELTVDPRSERLQLLQPWPAWDGRDFLDLPVLLKTTGKTTTDHISPAGAWLRYRGHLDKFSDNMFLGAINAFTGQAGRVSNLVTGEPAQPIARVARDYRARGWRWVVVGDANYGEGSSREHAALSPRLLGGAAIIARSFARIHESNLKKQGLLALTFEDAADYARIREDDRISLLALANMAPGEPVECVVRHADGTCESLRLRHSFSASQLPWFRAGSALNAMNG